MLQIHQMQERIKEDAHPAASPLRIAMRLMGLLGELYTPATKKELKDICGIMSITLMQLSAVEGFPLPYGPYKLAEEHDDSNDPATSLVIWFGALCNTYTQDNEPKLHKASVQIALHHIAHHLDLFIRENFKNDNLLILTNISFNKLIK